MIKFNNRRNQYEEEQLLNFLENLAVKTGAEARNLVRVNHPRLLELRDFIPWHTMQLWVVLGVVSLISLIIGAMIW